MHPRSSAIDVIVGGEATRGRALYIIGQSRRVTTSVGSRAGCSSREYSLGKEAQLLTEGARGLDSSPEFNRVV